jgi:hypothetical protein
LFALLGKSDGFLDQVAEGLDVLLFDGRDGLEQLFAAA